VIGLGTPSGGAPGPRADELVISREAAVLGDAGGEDTGPPIRGERPVPGVSHVSGIGSVQKLDGVGGGSRRCALMEAGS
jgi:hypothetical protein